jgi:hypothetical protein
MKLTYPTEPEHQTTAESEPLPFTQARARQNLEEVLFWAWAQPRPTESKALAKRKVKIPATRLRGSSSARTLDEVSYC